MYKKNSMMKQKSVKKIKSLNNRNKNLNNFNKIIHFNNLIINKFFLSLNLNFCIKYISIIGMLK
jgi:hypothetical protein